MCVCFQHMLRTIIKIQSLYKIQPTQKSKRCVKNAFEILYHNAAIVHCQFRHLGKLFLQSHTFSNSANTMFWDCNHYKNIFKHPRTQNKYPPCKEKQKSWFSECGIFQLVVHNPPTCQCRHDTGNASACLYHHLHRMLRTIIKIQSEKKTNTSDPKIQTGRVKNKFVK